MRMRKRQKFTPTITRIHSYLQFTTTTRRQCVLLFDTDERCAVFVYFPVGTHTHTHTFVYTRKRGMVGSGWRLATTITEITATRELVFEMNYRNKKSLNEKNLVWRTLTFHNSYDHFNTKNSKLKQKKDERSTNLRYVCVRVGVRKFACVHVVLFRGSCCVLDKNWTDSLEDVIWADYWL